MSYENVPRVLSYKSCLDSCTEDDHEKITAVLEILSNFPMTFELLVETRIGKSVTNAYKRCRSCEVLAKSLNNRWKRIVKKAFEHPENFYNAKKYIEDQKATQTYKNNEKNLTKPSH